MREKHVLSSCIKSRAAYDKIADHVSKDDFTEQGWIIWESVDDYFGRDSGAGYVDVDILTDAVTRDIAVDKHKEMFANSIAALGEFECSVENVVEDFIATRRDRVGQKLAAAIHAREDTTKLVDEYTELLTATTLAEEEEEDARIGLSVEKLIEDGFDPSSLIQLSPSSLNERMDGGVKPGHHIILFARPEMGKTMMTIEMMSGFARQGLKTLYIGNEDPIDDINMRIVNRLSGMTKMQVLNKPKEADTKAREAGYESIILKGLAPGSPREITRLIEAYKPDVLVLDQLRNLNMHQDNYVLKLEEAATQARLWAKRYSCVVVSVTQAGDSASNKAVLDLGDVDYSNTGIPSQADVMVGLGASKVHKDNGQIVISLPKNKVSGRHEFFAVAVEPEISKLVSLE